MTLAARVFTLIAASAAVLAAQPAANAGQYFDRQVSTLDHELLPLAEAMPAEKYGFAPKDGEFTGVRTFGEQVSHTAAVIYAVAASVLGEKNPTDMGPNENGPASLKGKDDIVKYLKDSLAYAHKAAQSVTAANLMEPVQSAFGDNKVPRLAMIDVIAWHSFDHYGQMVVYARMNGVVPPASRR